MSEQEHKAVLMDDLNLIHDVLHKVRAMVSDRDEAFVEIGKAMASCRALLSQAAPSVPTITDERWLVDGGLIYSLRDGVNHYEINVSMANGSRNTSARNAFANHLLALLSQAAPAVSDDSDLLDIVRTMCAAAAHLRDMSDEMRENYPSPLSEFSPLLIAARQACVNRGFTADGLSIDAAIASQSKGGAA